MDIQIKNSILLRIVLISALAATVVGKTSLLTDSASPTTKAPGLYRSARDGRYSALTPSYESRCIRCEANSGYGYDDARSSGYDRYGSDYDRPSSHGKYFEYQFDTRPGYQDRNWYIQGVSRNDRYDDRRDYDRYDQRRPNSYDRYDDRDRGYDRHDRYDYRGNGYDNRGDYRGGSNSYDRYDDRYDRGAGYDRYDRYDNRYFRPWDETYRGTSGFDYNGRGYYFAGRPDRGQQSGSWGSGYDRGYASNWNYGGNGSGSRGDYGYNRGDYDRYGYSSSGGSQYYRPYRTYSSSYLFDRENPQSTTPPLTDKTISTDKISSGSTNNGSNGSGSSGGAGVSIPNSRA